MTKVDGGASPHSRYLYEYQPEIRRPQRALPRGSCDVQVHIYSGDIDYPMDPGRMYDPPAGATFEAAQRVHRGLGIERGVLVHSTVHGTDNRLLVESLAKDPEHYRGIALIADTTTDAELLALDRAGVRGVRFQFKRSWGYR